MSDQQPPGGYPPPHYGQQPPGQGPPPQQPVYGSPPPPPGPPAYGQPPAGSPPPPPGPPGYGPPPGYGAPAQPPPGYGQPHPYGPPPSGNNAGAGKVLLIVGAAVAVLAIVGVALLLVLGGDNGPSSDSPEDTAAGFIAAAEEGDCEAAFEYVTDSLKEQLGDCADTVGVGGTGGEFGDPELVDESEDVATVDVPIELSDAGEFGALIDSFALNLGLVKQDGVWLVDSVGFGGLDLGDFEDQLDDFAPQ